MFPRAITYATSISIIIYIIIIFIVKHVLNSKLKDEFTIPPNDVVIYCRGATTTSICLLPKFNSSTLELENSLHAGGEEKKIETQYKNPAIYTYKNGKWISPSSSSSSAFSLTPILEKGILKIYDDKKNVHYKLYAQKKLKIKLSPSSGLFVLDEIRDVCNTKDEFNEPQPLSLQTYLRLLNISWEYKNTKKFELYQYQCIRGGKIKIVHK